MHFSIIRILNSKVFFVMCKSGRLHFLVCSSEVMHLATISVLWHLKCFDEHSDFLHMNSLNNVELEPEVWDFNTTVSVT